MSERILQVMAALALTGCSSAVGLYCADDRAECQGVCVDTDSDPANCGGCGIACPSGVCLAGVCDGLGGEGGLPLDGALGDGGMPDGALPDGALPDGALPDGALPDGGDMDGADMDGADMDADDMDADDMGPDDMGPDDMGPEELACDVGETECFDACVDADTDPDNCGGCGVACAFDEVCSAGVCEDVCADTLSFCSGRCVDVAEDNRNCGGCGLFCSTGLCNEGVCDDAVAGHVVVIGHDFEISSVAMERLLGNALSLGAGSPVRIVSFATFSRDRSLRGGTAAIGRIERERGRTFTERFAGPRELTAALRRADVFLIYPQVLASAAELTTQGSRWRVALSTFVNRGGVVVALEGPATNGGTHVLLEAAGIFEAAGIAPVSGSSLEVLEPADALTLNVALRFATPPGTMVLTMPTGSPILAGEPGETVIAHEVISP